MNKPVDSEIYDLAVLGGGTAGLIAAQGAAGLGARVVLIEPNPPGGDCLWTGCVPSKRLIAAAKAAYTMRTASVHGMQAVEPTIDFAAVMQSVDAARNHLAHHDSVETLEEARVEVVSARGCFVQEGQIQAGERIIRYRKAMIATGASPVVPGIPGLAEVDPLTSENLWQLRSLPSRLAVVGGGAIGCELGQAFSRLGSTVTIFEAAPRILPMLGENVSELITETFKAEGIVVKAGVGVTEVDRITSGSILTTADGATTGADAILVAVGRRANTGDIGLDNVGVGTDARGHVVVNDFLQTTNDDIFAGGDVVGKMPFTHTAAYHGGLVVSNAVFKLRRKVDYDVVPFAVFTDPEVASVGTTSGDDVNATFFAYDQLDRAVTTGEPTGFAELFSNGKRQLVGATVVGAAAGETINEMAYRVRSKSTLNEIGLMIRPYPTFGEGPGRAALSAVKERYFSPRSNRFTGAALSVIRRLDR